MNSEIETIKVNDISSNTLPNVNININQDIEVNLDEELYRTMPSPEDRTPPPVCRQYAFHNGIDFI